jgi:hypothetical protein
MTLYEKMQRLVQYIANRYLELRQNPGNHHHVLCMETAERFNLTSDQYAFPIWLSRVVEGVMRDIDENPTSDITL